MKVYVVCIGSYSSRDIDGIFTTREAADAHEALCSYRSQEHANKLAVELRQELLRKEATGLIVAEGKRKANWRIKALPKAEGP